MAYFEYFGFNYETTKDDKSVKLRGAKSAKGNVFIPKEVEYNNKKYPVIGILGGTMTVYKWNPGVEETDRRKKNRYKVEPHWDVDYYTAVSPFTGTNGYESDGDKQIIPNTTVKTVILPETITLLAEGAFRKCRALEEVNLPLGITDIPFLAFSGCRALKSIQLHEGITEIGNFAFFGCSAMKEITIPSTVTKIGENAFNDSSESKNGLEVVNILNDEGAVLMYPNSFTDRVKINYLGKNGAKKIAKAAIEKHENDNNVSIDLERLIKAALVDGVVTDKERAILIKKVKEAGGDVDEFEMLLDARIFETTKKNTKTDPKPAKETPKAEPKLAAKATAAAKGGLTVGSLVETFKKQFGAVLRIYNGRAKADDKMSLQEVGLTKDIKPPFNGKQTVGAFIEEMNQVGLKVKVYTCDEWVAVIDGLTLEQAGKVKKNATKADMEKML